MKSHFPVESEQISKGIESIRAHNEKYATQILEIKNAKEKEPLVNEFELRGTIITKNLRRASEEIDAKIDLVEKYWPGTRHYKFKKKQNSCLKCKEIFG